MSDQVMADPVPENIDGRKLVSHSFNHEIGHRIDWGHVALAVAAILAIYVLFLRGGSEVEDRDDLGNSVTR
jgi:hypothetical protein